MYTFNFLLLFFDRKRRGITEEIAEWVNNK